MFIYYTTSKGWGNMSELYFEYYMQITFSEMARNHSFTLKCLPHSDERQEIQDLELKLYPEVDYETGRDSFGNWYIFGNINTLHNKFEVTVTGKARTGLSSFVTGEEDLLALYTIQDEYTKPGAGLLSMFDRLYEKKETNLETAIHMMEGLWKEFTYLSASTNVRTTAEEAVNQGCGVCQDYSQILISLCRMAGIPARYVVGMLEGEGESHAWVEIYESLGEHKGWYGLDPTNNVMVQDGNVIISHGRNYKDCRINRGIFFGGGVQAQQVKVKLEVKK